MKICFFIYNISSPGGSERVTTIIANQLKKLNYDIRILSVCGNGKPFYTLDNSIPIHIIYKDKENINSKVKYFDILRKSLLYHKNNETDLIIDVFTSRSLISIPVKKILKIKNISWEHFNYYAKIGLNPLGRNLACKFSNQIITLTDEDRKYYRDNNKINGKIDYIYNPSPYPIVDSTDLSNKRVISVGRLTHQKGYDMLLKAWQKVEEKSDWELILLGDGDEKESLINLANKLKLKNVKFLGVKKDVPEYYKKSSIYVSSSRFEGLPMCMIEAQSFGLPIVAFDCKTGPSEIINNNKDGFLIKNENIEELAEKLLLLINDRDKLEKFSLEARKSAKRFTLEEIIKNWQELLEKIN